MSPILVIFIALGVLQSAYTQAIGYNNYNGCANGLLPNGFTPTGFIPAPGLPNYPIGYGDVAVAGELPVGGSTAVAGQVPVIGYVMFEGNIPAGGIVSVANNCGCGNGIY